MKFVDKLMFTRRLSIMLRAGVPVAEALGVLESQSRDVKVKKTMVAVRGGVNDGLTLEESLNRADSKSFDSLYRSIIGIGEESGTLETNLDYLTSELSKAYEFRKKVQAALLYPAIIMVVGVIVGGGVAVFVLPNLVNLFSALEVDLPWSTRLLLWVSIMVKNHGLWLALGIAGGVGLGIWGVRTSRGKRLWERGILNLPKVGEFFADVQVTSLCRNLGLMLKSGMPINGALASCVTATENSVFKDYIKSMRDAVDRGESLEEDMMNRKYKYIPEVVGHMIGVGEKSGKLDETLLYLADFFGDEVDGLTKNLGAVLEPVMLVVIALIVGFMALAIISPIYQLTGGVHR